jgi:uncharacterized protein YcbK (DUF882 family)
VYGVAMVSLRRRELLLGSGVAVVLASAALAAPSTPRRLELKNAHTGETFAGAYRDAEGPIPGAMADLALLLRDHHVDRTGPVDVATLDFLADVMATVGQSRATVLSAYRTPETNAKLARTRFGVAEHSQHIYGRALDVAFDRSLGEAHRAARGMRRGGVGWYPRSHFIHLDTGPLRYWEMDGAGFGALLAGQPLGRPRTVAERRALHRALARREFLTRR